MTRAEKFIPKILFAEGGDKVTNDKNDSGGLTKYGISQKAFPGVDIVNLKESDAIAIYKKIYFDPCKIDLINDELLALHIFDFAVNSGVSRSIKTIQKVVGVHVDGILGKGTLSSINSGNYVKEFIQARKDFYNLIGVGKNAKFLKGWLNRVNSLKI